MGSLSDAKNGKTPEAARNAHCAAFKVPFDFQKTDVLTVGRYVEWTPVSG